MLDDNKLYNLCVFRSSLVFLAVFFKHFFLSSSGEHDMIYELFKKKKNFIQIICEDLGHQKSLFSSCFDLLYLQLLGD